MQIILPLTKYKAVAENGMDDAVGYKLAAKPVKLAKQDFAMLIYCSTLSFKQNEVPYSWCKGAAELFHTHNPYLPEYSMCSQPMAHFDRFSSSVDK